jgi:serine protease Do
MKVEAKLVPIVWDDTEQDPSLGSFVSAVGPDDEPLAVGLISVAERSLSAKDKPFLGVGLESADEGLRVTEVLRGSAAAKAGLKKNDVITAMDGKHYDSVQQFIEDLQKRKPGGKVKIEYRREGKELNAQPELGDRTLLPEQGPGLGRYPQGGRLSKNRGGYPSALQTDLPIQPQECGSPVVGLDGRALGINIARAGRIKSYAIPAGAIRELLQSAIPKPKTTSD